MTNYMDVNADADFRKAINKATMHSIFSKFRWRSNVLLSYYEVTKLIHPKSETYKGVMAIPVDKIIGSENRYNDFSRAFLPKKNMLRRRWENIDNLVKNFEYLPPISVYELAGYYFVRDGNHRVSVAKSQGVSFIDAEVVALTSEIPLSSDMTLHDLKKNVVEYERKRFIDQYNPTYLPMNEITFSTPGSYPELVNHILVHKYFVNETIPDREISFEEAATSWYKNVWSPIVQAIRHHHLLAEFPGQTEGDMYMWLVRKWDQLKQKNSKATPEDVSEKTFQEGKKGLFHRWFAYLKEKTAFRR